MYKGIGNTEGGGSGTFLKANFLEVSAQVLQTIDDFALGLFCLGDHIEKVLAFGFILPH